MHYFLNPDHTYRPCSLLEWATQLEMKDRRVQKTELNGYFISTVWLGNDHGYDPEKPLVFETMVFKGGSSQDIYCERYSTWDEAVLGHHDAIEWVKQHANDLEVKYE